MFCVVGACKTLYKGLWAPTFCLGVSKSVVGWTIKDMRMKIRDSEKQEDLIKLNKSVLVKR